MAGKTKTPDWGQWRQMVEWRLSEALLLSVDMEPDPRRVAELDRFASYADVDAPSGELGKRARAILSVLESRQPKEYGLVLCGDLVSQSGILRFDSRVRPADFLLWCEGAPRQWAVPDGLRAIAEEAAKRDTTQKPLPERSRKAMLRIIRALALYAAHEKHRLPTDPYSAGEVLVHFAQQHDIELKADTVGKLLTEARREIG
jgi:hypothetical protein